MLVKSEMRIIKVNWPIFFMGWVAAAPCLALLVGSVMMALQSVSGWGWVLMAGVILYLSRGKVLKNYVG